MLQTQLRILQAYKVAHTELYGGIPEVIRLLATPRSLNVSNSILAARRRGFGRNLMFNQIPLRLTGSLGTIASMPIAPTYPFVLVRSAQKAHVIALHLPFPLSNLGIWLGIPERVALVVHWHSEIMHSSRLSKALEPIIHLTLSRADRIIVSTQRNFENSPMLAPYRDKCDIVPFGVETAFWGGLHCGESAEVERLVAGHPRLVLAVGRLVPYKGFDILIDALRLVDATAIIVGSGPEGRNLQKRINLYGLADRVALAGNISRERLRVLLHTASVFVLPSTTNAETFGISQLEAMSAGLPIVNTALSSGVPTVARDGVEALTVRPGDPGALAYAICRLLDDRALAKALGAGGRERATSEFTHDRFVDRMHAIYKLAFNLRRGKSHQY
jgi:glycosyltransferase involved in cell wall biosynthesis